VLVLDAATSAVDAAKEEEIHGALTGAMQGRTTIVITHRAATLRLADRVLILEDGRIADTGKHAELLRRSAYYRRILASAGAQTPVVPAPAPL
jgi:ATP-binding cassette, subfamily B, bacterial